MAEEGKTPQPDEEKKSTASDNLYEIRLNSYTISNALGVNAVHNEIAFYKPDGTSLLTFDGNAFDTQTGDFKRFALSPDHTLRLTVSDKTQADWGMYKAASVTLDKVDMDGLLKKLNAISEAGKFINGNNINYVIVGGPHYEAQNSNSVAATLVGAMGYPYPHEQLSHVWAPGAKRNLLPDDWSSNEDHYQKTLAGITQLSGAIVRNSVRAEKIPKHVAPEVGNVFPVFFNPNESTVPYVKKGQETVLPPGTNTLTSLIFTRTPIEPVKELTAEEKAAKLDKDLERDAIFETFKALDQFVKNATGLDSDAIDKLSTDDPKTYYTIAQQELAKTSGTLQTTARCSLEEMDNILAEKLRVPVKDLYDQPFDVRDKAYGELDKSGAFNYKRDNPHLRKILEDAIKTGFEEIERDASPQNTLQLFTESKADITEPDQPVVEAPLVIIQPKPAQNDSLYLSTGTHGPR